MRDIVAYCNGLSKAEFWSLGMGDVQNLLDEALEEIERLRANAEDALTAIGGYSGTIYDAVRDILDGARFDGSPS